MHELISWFPLLNEHVCLINAYFGLLASIEAYFLFSCVSSWRYTKFSVVSTMRSSQKKTICHWRGRSRPYNYVGQSFFLNMVDRFVYLFTTQRKMSTSQKTHLFSWDSMCSGRWFILLPYKMSSKVTIQNNNKNKY